LAGQPELDSQGSRKIYQLAVALGWLESNLCGSFFGRQVESVALELYHADDPYRPDGLDEIA